MVLFVFVGLFVARLRSRALGWAIVALAAVFLGFTQSKTAIAIMPLSFALAAVIERARAPAVAIALVVGGLALFNLFTVGTVVFEPVHRLVAAVLPDATFTGRTEIWE